MSSSSSNREGSLLENSRSQSNPMPIQPMKRTPAPAPIANISSNIQTTKPPKTEDQLIAIFKGIVDKSNLMPNTESFIEVSNSYNYSYKFYIYNYVQRLWVNK